MTIPTLALLSLATARVAQGQTAALEGERIESVRVVDESGRVLNKEIPKLPVEAGQPFHIEEERDSLQQLYRTGLYADIHAEAAPVPGGLRLDFVVRRNYYNNVVRIEGLHEPPSEGYALAALRLGLGETFRESAVREGLAQLADALRQEGLYRAKTDYALTPHDDTRQMDVTIHVVAGPRAGVGGIQFKNHTEFADAELLRHAKLDRGDRITSNRLGRAAQRIRKFLTKANHLGARVTVERGAYDAAANSVPLVIDVSAGPKVRVAVSGTRMRAARVKKLIPIYAEGSVDEDLLQEGRRNLREALQGEGYFDAQVDYNTGTGEKGEQLITYTVDKGKRHKLVGVGFDGNKYFSGELLESRLAIQTASFASPGHFSQQLVRDDADSIRGLYLSNGFIEAKVDPEVDDDYGGKVGNLFVRFHITEGSQTRVAGLKLTGNHALKDEELLNVTGSTKGQPYSDANVASDRNNILALYFNEGFPDARFESDVEQASEPNRMQLTYRITEGKQVRVDRTLITGYEYTRPKIIQRQVQVKAEAPLREGDVVETQRRLYNLGIFTRVQVAPQNPRGTAANKDVVVEVQEGNRYTIGYGGGLEAQRLGGVNGSPASSSFSISPLGIFEVSRANFLGRAQTVAFKVRASTFQYRGLLSYSIPDFFARQHFSLVVTTFADKTRDVQTFTAQRYEGSIELAQTLTPITTLLYRYTFRRVVVPASSLRILPAQIPLLSQPTLISAFGITWVRDRRNNPADPSRGSFNTADVSLPEKAIGSSANFLRVFVQNSTYHPFGRAMVFARSTQFGVEKPLRGTTPAQIPLPERFFAGGGTSIRGFSLNDAGPRDATGFPIGGLALLAFNQEVRFPMRLPFVGNLLGGAVFYDAGNVFSTVSLITLRWSPPSLTDLSYFSHTIGFGFRYATPIGPVRLDLGYQLNPARFSIVNTNTIPPTTQTARIPHFQFFFNIGSSF